MSKPRRTLEELYKQYDDLLRAYQFECDQEKARKIKHDLRNIIMIIKYKEEA